MPHGVSRERLAPGFLNWVLGILVVYSALFALRELLFGTLPLALVLIALAVGGGVVLSKRLD
jgi:hypothetical protein